MRSPGTGAFVLKKENMPVSLTLGRSERLKSRKLIGRVFEKGRKMNQGSLRVHYILDRSAAAEKELQVGVTVSSKTFRKATDRNRIKRLLREAWRLQKNELREMVKSQGQLLVFIIYTGKEMASFDRISEDIRSVISHFVSQLK